jgi:hypothetical protein
MGAVAIDKRHAAKVRAVQGWSFANIADKLVNLVQQLSFLGYVKGAYLLELDAKRPAEYLCGFFAGDEGPRL